MQSLVGELMQIVGGAGATEHLGTSGGSYQSPAPKMHKPVANSFGSGTAVNRNHVPDEVIPLDDEVMLEL